MNIKFDTVKIRHINATVPKRTVDTLSLDFDEDVLKKIVKNTGIKQRHVVVRGETIVDLGIPSAEKTLEMTGWERESVDGVIVVSQCHEYKLPTTANVLHGKLGLKKDALAFDIKQGCTGYGYGLYSAFSTLASSGGAVRRVLLFVGDTSSLYCYPKNRSNASLFGDGMSCTALEFDENADDSFFVLKSDGSGYTHIIVEHGGFRHLTDESSFEEYEDKDGNVTTKASLHMNGLEVFNFTIAQVPPLIEDLIAFSGVSKEDMNVFCMHQANKYIIDYLSKKMKTKDRTPINIDRFGNTSCTSIPLLIADKPDECLVKNAVLCGFGVGWSLAACLVNLNDTTVSFLEV